MRRQEREVSDPEHLAGILGRAVTAHVAFLDRGEPAVVPLSFGFEVRDGVFHFYFHGAAEGRKAECWRADPRVSASLSALPNLCRVRPGAGPPAFTRA